MVDVIDGKEVDVWVGVDGATFNGVKLTPTVVEVDDLVDLLASGIDCSKFEVSGKYEAL